MADLEGSLSDASLIEDDEEEEIAVPPGGDDSMDSNLTIDLPGDPITADAGDGDREETTTIRRPESPWFHGWDPTEIGKPQAEAEPAASSQATKPAAEDVPTAESSQLKEATTPPKVPPLVLSTKKLAPTPKPELKTPTASTPATPATSSGSLRREWRPSAQFFKPLAVGWVREVITRDSPGKLPEIVYHPPPKRGFTRSFSTGKELEGYLRSENSNFTIFNFSFRKEPMGAPEGQEIIHKESEQVEIYPKKTPDSDVNGPGSTPKASTPKVSDVTVGFKAAGGLKIKMFSKMKEKNAIDNIKKDDDGEEDFDLGSSNQDPQVPAKSKVKVEGTGGSKLLSKLQSSTISITPVSQQQSGSAKPPGNIHLPAGVTLTSQTKPPFSKPPNNKSSSAPTKSVLRPKVPGSIACSIHCTGASSVPSLSCTACQCMFHPRCVGLSDHLNYGMCSFYCNDCQPPVSQGKENIRRPPPSAPPPRRPAPPPASRPPGPLRPIESQSVINIGGHKFLVVPHPNVDDRATKSGKPPAAGNEKLPVLLQPTAGTPQMPSFEVEETAEGRLMLIPMDAAGANPFAKAAVKRKGSNATFEASSPKRPMTVETFTSNLSQSYFAMLHIFRYLSSQERLQATRVCRLWRELAYHPSLWRTVSLRNCRISCFDGFVSFMHRTKSSHLDLRKLLYSKSSDDCWTDLATAASALTFVTRIDFPRISGTHLVQVVKAMRNLEAVTATSVVQGINLGEIPKQLTELKLKSSGSLKLNDEAECGLKPLADLPLLRLSLVTLDPSLVSRNLPILPSLSRLETLELGNCSAACQQPDEFFRVLSTLPKLRSLRLERGSVDVQLGQLALLPQLAKLELIDFRLQNGFGEALLKLKQLKQLLIIPVYKDEVAAINMELVDTALSLTRLTHFFLGLTNEWLESMNSLTDHSRENFPILVNDACEMYSLSKLFKTLSSALVNTKVKILKMSRQSTTKQYISSLTN